MIKLALFINKSPLNLASNYIYFVDLLQDVCLASPFGFAK